jgi:hypothetical protein
MRGCMFDCIDSYCCSGTGVRCDMAVVCNLVSGLYVNAGLMARLGVAVMLYTWD